MVKYCVFVLVIFLSITSCHDADNYITTVKIYCETVDFIKTDFAVEWQIQTLPDTVNEALAQLDRKGETNHFKYLAYLMLRERKKQASQFGVDYTLHPAVPSAISERIKKFLNTNGYHITDDASSAEYAHAILLMPTLFDDYETGQQFSSSLRKMLSQ